MSMLHGWGDFCCDVGICCRRGAPWGIPEERVLKALVGFANIPSLVARLPFLEDQSPAIGILPE